jgi:serine/threonine protein kinase
MLSAVGVAVLGSFSSAMKAREANSRSSLVGSRIGKFDVVAEIGTGGMASVYLARSSAQGGFNRLAAIKVMHPHLSQEDSFVEMFLDEARVAATIQHPNVISIVDVGIEDGLIFLVMDYVEGDSFSSVEKMAVNLRRRIPLGITLRVVLDSLAGLHHAHELTDHDGQPQRIVHRDVSPQNIMVGVDGVSRIVDFGIAKAESRITTTQVGLIKGKLNFMAPEQIRGGGIDRRVDIFGMGVTLWEAVTLRRLFAGNNDFDTARRILSGEYPSLRETDPKLPPALDDICRKALASNPDERYLTAEEFAVAIETHLRQHIAAPREVTAFISGVAAQKLESERRALRESSPGIQQSDQDDADDEGAFMTTTMVEYPSSTSPSIDAISAVLPSSSAPRDQSMSEGTARSPRLRAATMSMPSHGTQAPKDIGGNTKSLRAPPAQPVTSSSPPGSREEYDDDGATSPFHDAFVVDAAKAFRAIAPAQSKQPSPSVKPQQAPKKTPSHYPDEDDVSTQDGPLRDAANHAYPRREYMPPLNPNSIPSPKDSTDAINLVQRRVQPEPDAHQAPTVQPHSMPPGVYSQQPSPVMFPQIPPDPPGVGVAVEDAPKGVPAAVYVVVSLVLVGGAAALLWYVLFGGGVT